MKEGACMGKRKKIEKRLAVYKKMQKGFLHILLIVLVCFGMVQMGELQEVQAARSDLMTLEGEKDVVAVSYTHLDVYKRQQIKCFLAFLIRR